MKILYVTDLHGDKKKYRKILDVAIEKEIKVIVNGGDMLPKQCDRHSEQSLKLILNRSAIRSFVLPMMIL